MTPLDKPTKVLSREQREQFVQDGYVIIRDVFPREVAERVLPLLWAELKEDPKDPSTWTADGRLVAKSIFEGAAAEVVTKRYRDAVDELLFADRVKPMSACVGYSPIRFPVKQTSWEPVGFHVDGIHFQHHVNSREQGLIGLDLLTDVDAQGGGTAIRPGSHHTVAAILAAAEPAGMTCGEIGDAARAATVEFSVVEVIGNAGDVLLMHPHLVHGSSTNLSNRVRMAANRCVSLLEPMNFNRTNDADYSLVEWAVKDDVSV
ncbi:MAG: phytanoyl-CoA dioxygenase family protein [Planctomycetota bacterium]|nr:phytanoyl-CoA dioxygenase family protein [Planctomycetota bacterium]MDA1137591.1 phytanoyl-CoA dioxygenase family protein [Planctomycetota bacterium]